MANSKMNPKVDFFFNKPGKWQEEYQRLRMIILTTELTEELKWGCPCYTLAKKNIVLIHGFKDYCALLFFKGAMLKDESGILIRQTENVQSSRQLRFTSFKEITKLKSIIKSYVLEAIEVEMSGAKMKFKKTREYSVPEEFQNKLDEMPELQTAFKALTPGRQRGYLLYFSAPKQSKTREARVVKSMQKIFSGIGLND